MSAKVSAIESNYGIVDKDAPVVPSDSSSAALNPPLTDATSLLKSDAFWACDASMSSTTTAPIDAQLYDTMVVCVLEWLPLKEVLTQLSAVSLRWRRLATLQSRGRSALELPGTLATVRAWADDETRGINAGIARLIKQYGHGLKRVNFESRADLDVATLRLLGKHTSELRYLNLSDSLVIAAADINAIIGRNAALTHVNLVNRVMCLFVIARCDCISR
jgi:hypothetical protein